MAPSVRSTQRRGEAARMTALLHKLPAAISFLNQIAIWVFFGSLWVYVCDFLSQRAFKYKNDHVVKLDDPASVLADKSGVRKLDAFFIKRVPVRDPNRRRQDFSRVDTRRSGVNYPSTTSNNEAKKDDTNEDCDSGSKLK